MKFFKLFRDSDTLKLSSIFIILGAIFFIANGFVYLTQYVHHSYDYDRAGALQHFDGIMDSYQEYFLIIDNYFIEFSNDITENTFTNFMSEILNDDTSVVSIIVSPSGVIEFTYPEDSLLVNESFLAGKETIDLTHINEAIINDSTYCEYNATLNQITMIHPIYIEGSFYGYMNLNISLDEIYNQYGTFEGKHYNAIFYDETMSTTLLQSESIEVDEYLTLSMPGMHLKIAFFHDINTYNSTNVYLLVYTVTGIIFFGVLLLFVYGVVKDRENLKIQVHSYEGFDQYSKLPNSKRLFDYIDRLLLKKTEFYLAFGKLNNMKYINEKYGHHVGNELLLRIIDLIQKEITSNTSIFHYGGDEYCIVIESDSKMETRNILNRVSNVFESDISVKSIRANFSITFGVVKFPEQGNSLESLIKNATLVIEDPRVVNKNVVVFYEKRALFSNKINEELEKIISKMDLELLEVYLMPIVETQTDRITGFECLTRAFDDEKTPFNTQELVQILEKNGRIQELDEIVFKKMLKIMKRINNQYEDDLYLSLNASALSLNDEYVDNVIRYYKDANLTKGTIVLELTESYKVDDFDYLIRLFKRLNQAGIKIAIDDFGSGYSSLSYITRFPIYAIKIDKEYVRDFGDNDFNKTLIFTLTSIAEVLKCKLIAEGVDSMDTLEFLKANNCPFYQGFFFSEGVPLEEAIKLLIHSNIKSS
ncbi:MAG: GGDEF and EAL domain-containing protein [Firmicutes bacterium]|nr:GGDEF and EAL domain-containing protein [Bacillota bacterium]